jgi:hypothetical protein
LPALTFKLVLGVIALLGETNMTKRLLLSTIAFLTALPVSANTWSGETVGGVRSASVISEENEIMVLCDAGINAPITSINFVVNGVTPLPQSNIVLFFDKDAPLYVTTDVEGGIGSATLPDAEKFTQVIDLMKSSNRLKVRLFDGSSHTFRLTGSTKAIGNCTADFHRYELALN